MDHLRHERAPAPARDRIVAIDALRGFALFGIVAVHMVEQYTAAPPPTTQPDFGTFSPIDQITRGLVALLFMGKFFALFSVLFGLSFFIQMDRAAARNLAFQWRFMWRLTVLLAIGVLHHLFYRGDILSIYAAIGLFLVPFYRAGDRTVLVAAALFCLGAPRPLLIGLAALGLPVPDLAGMSAANDAYYAILRGPSLLDVFAINIGEGMRAKWEFQLSVFGRGYQTLGLFLVGLYVGRRRWHESIAELRRPLRRLTVGGLVVSLVVAGLLAAFMALQSGTPSLLSWQAAVGFTCYDVFNLALMSSFAGAFLLSYHRPRGQRVLCHLAPVGRMALTTYVCQSIAGTFFYYGYGLGRLGEIGAATAFLLAMLLFSAQIVASAVWLRYFQFGPLEWLWRSLTYGRMQRLRKAADHVVPTAGGSG